MSPPGATRITPPAGGGGRFTVQVREAGEPSVLPAASVARTSKVCEPFVSPEYAFGDVQTPQGPASRGHWKRDPASEELKPRLADPVVTVPDGPESIVVFGAVVSGG